MEDKTSSKMGEEEMNIYILLLSVAIGSTLLYAAPLLYASMGSLFSELSGVVNIGIDGMMTFGAFVGFATAYYTGNPWFSFLMGGVGAAFFGLLHAIACIHLRADHTVSGIAINFIAPAAAAFISQLLFDGSVNTPPLPLDAKIPKLFNFIFRGQDSDWYVFFGNILNNYASTVLAFLVVGVSWFFIYKTRYGLRLRACGEHPKAAASLGVNVYRTRYIAVILSGFLAGLGGASITMATISSFRPNISTGQGYIAIAAVIFGKYKPSYAMFACVLFGFCNAMTVFMGNPELGLEISPNLLSLLPYIITLVALFFMGRSYVPKASGKLYTPSN